MSSRPPADTGLRRRLPGSAFQVPGAEPATQATAPEQDPEEAPGQPAHTAQEGPKPTPRRTDGRAGRTLNVQPALIAAIDHAFHHTAAQLPKPLKKAAFYEAVLVVGLRHLEEVAGLVAQDPAGRRAASEMVGSHSREYGAGGTAP
jgi:hypothetical protein